MRNIPIILYSVIALSILSGCNNKANLLPKETPPDLITNNEIIEVAESSNEKEENNVEQNTNVTVLSAHQLNHPNGTEHTVYIAVSPIEKEIFFKKDVTYFCSEEDIFYPVVYEFIDKESHLVLSKHESSNWYDVDTKTAYLKLRIPRPKDDLQAIPIAFWYAHPGTTRENPSGALRVDPLFATNPSEEPIYYLHTETIFNFSFSPKTTKPTTVLLNEKFYIDTYGKTGSVTHVEIYPAGVIWFCQIPGITEDWNLHQNSDYYISAVQAFQDHVKESSLTLTDGTIIPIYSGEASSVMHSDTYVATCLFKENDLVKMLDNSTTYVSINSNSYSVTNEN